MMWIANNEIEYIKHKFRDQKNSVHSITVRGEFTISMITTIDLMALRDFNDEIIYLELFNREIVTTYAYV